MREAELFLLRWRIQSTVADMRHAVDTATKLKTTRTRSGPSTWMWTTAGPGMSPIARILGSIDGSDLCPPP